MAAQKHGGMGTKSMIKSGERTSTRFGGQIQPRFVYTLMPSNSHCVVGQSVGYHCPIEHEQKWDRRGQPSELPHAVNWQVIGIKKASLNLSCLGYSVN